MEAIFLAEAFNWPDDSYCHLGIARMCWRRLGKTAFASELQRNDDPTPEVFLRAVGGSHGGSLFFTGQFS